MGWQTEGTTFSVNARRKASETPVFIAETKIRNPVLYPPEL